MKGIHTKFEIEGIGPHETKLTLDEILKSNQVAIFARNGSGKSFIGRVFRLVSRIGWKVSHGNLVGRSFYRRMKLIHCCPLGNVGEGWGLCSSAKVKMPGRSRLR